MAASDLPLEPLAKPAPELSLIGKWRWNALAALFAALLLVALTLRRWRRAEVTESSAGFGVIERAMASPRFTLAIVVSVPLLAAALALIPQAGDKIGNAPLVTDQGDVIEVGGVFSGEASADLKCAQCGVVESTREMDQLPETSAKRVEVTVRMKDGASHRFIAASSANSSNPESSANWRAGERVIFIDGRRLAGE